MLLPLLLSLLLLCVVPIEFGMMTDLLKRMKKKKKKKKKKKIETLLIVVILMIVVKVMMLMMMMMIFGEFETLVLIDLVVIVVG